METITNETICPHCKEYDLDDDDGVNLDHELKTTVECQNCRSVFYFQKQFEYNPRNPYCDYEWTKTYFRKVDDE